MKRGYYIGLDAHKRTCEFAVVRENGQLVQRLGCRTAIDQLAAFLQSIPRPRYLVVEEGPMADWLWRNLRWCMDDVTVCDPFRNHLIAKEGEKDDPIDAAKLAELFRGGYVKAVHHTESFEQAVFKQKVGPFTAEQIGQMAASGVIRPTDMVLQEGKQKWCPFSEVPVLAPANGKPREYAGMKVLGLTGTSATLVLGSMAATAMITAAMVLIVGLWAVGAFRSKQESPNPTRQVEAKPNPEPVNQVEAKPNPEPVNQVEAKPNPEPVNQVEAKSNPEPVKQAGQDVPAPEMADGEKPPVFWIGNLSQAEPARSKAIDALVKMGGKAVPDLRQAVRDQNRVVSTCAVITLGRIGPDATEAVPTLMLMLDDHDRRSEAAEALGLIGPAAQDAALVLVVIMKKQNLVEPRLLTALERINFNAAFHFKIMRELEKTQAVLQARYELEAARLGRAKAEGNAAEIQNAALAKASIAIAQAQNAAQLAQVDQRLARELFPPKSP